MNSYRFSALIWSAVLVLCSAVHFGGGSGATLRAIVIFGIVAQACLFVLMQPKQ